MRRYSRGDNEENEATTVKSNNDNSDSREQQGAVTQLPPRLYPDLPREHYPGAYGPQYGVNPNYGPQSHPSHGPPTPFVPFGPQIPANRLNGGVGGILDPTNHRRIPMQRSMTPTERAQSQSFVSGLGRRLLAMVGVEMPSSLNDTSSTSSAVDKQLAAQTRSDQDPMMRALQNSTVLQQLNKGVQSIYGSLSKMYNSTVQQQIDLLQERFKKEAENSTNPWQQRMAQQVPQFFKNMAAKVEGAQENLNRIWRQVSQANNGTIDSTSGRSQQQAGTRSFFDQFNGYTVDDAGYHPGNFMNQIGRSFGFGFGDNDPIMNPNDRQNRDFASQFMDFWHNQVQPQISMVRGQISHVWRDLTSSGALMPEQLVRVRNNNPNFISENPSGNADNKSSSDFVDNILNGIDLNNSEYSLIEPKDDPQQQQRPPMNNVGSQVQTKLIAMQRELNQLWSGLTNSLQGAIGNVRQALNPRPQFNQLDSIASNNNKQDIDPAQNEIGDRIKDITKLQKDADVVYDVVQRQQQVQQNQGIGDRFRNFFNNMDFGSVEQLPNRFSNSVSRFGNAVGDLWNQIPRRWDNFMNNMRQPDQMSNARLTSPDTKSKNQTENVNQ